jgi:hypothetical protein
LWRSQSWLRSYDLNRIHQQSHLRTICTAIAEDVAFAAPPSPFASQPGRVPFARGGFVAQPILAALLRSQSYPPAITPSDDLYRRRSGRCLRSATFAVRLTTGTRAFRARRFCGVANPGCALTISIVSTSNHTLGRFVPPSQRTLPSQHHLRRSPHNRDARLSREGVLWRSQSWLRSYDLNRIHQQSHPRTICTAVAAAVAVAAPPSPFASQPGRLPFARGGFVA